MSYAPTCLKSSENALTMTFLYVIALHGEIEKCQELEPSGVGCDEESENNSYYSSHHRRHENNSPASWRKPATDQGNLHIKKSPEAWCQFSLSGGRSRLRESPIDKTMNAMQTQANPNGLANS